jgi:hypothetical protein
LDFLRFPSGLRGLCGLCSVFVSGCFVSGCFVGGCFVNGCFVGGCFVETEDGQQLAAALPF